MKKLLLLCTVAMLFACKNGNENAPQQIKRLNIKNAEFVYKNGDGNTKATFADFMQITKQDKIEPVCFISVTGDTVMMSINKIFNLNEDYIFLNGYFSLANSEYRNILVNKKTENIYGIPSDIIISPEDAPYSDRYNNIYLCGGEIYGLRDMIYKIKVSGADNMTIEKYVPDGFLPITYIGTKSESSIDDDLKRPFIVDKNGVCAGLEMLKCPGGRLYQIEEDLGIATKNQNHSFIYGFDKSIYIVGSKIEPGVKADLTVYRIEYISDNELRAVEVCKNTLVSTSVGERTRFVFGLRNSIRKSHVTGTYYDYYGSTKSNPEENILEFNETSKTLTFESIPLYVSASTPRTKDSWWIWSEYENRNTIKKTSMVDYSESTITINAPGIKILSVVGSEKSINFTYTGLRLSDGKNVMGEIDPQGNTTISEKISQGSTITELIPLN